MNPADPIYEKNKYWMKPGENKETYNQRVGLTTNVPATPAPADQNILSQLQKKRDEAVSSYTSFLQGQPSQLDLMKQYGQELGVPQKLKDISDIQGQVNKTEDILNNLEGQLNSRIQGMGVTEAQRQRRLQIEEKPYREQYSQLVTGLGRAETGLTNLRQLMSDYISAAQSGQTRQAEIAKTQLEYMLKTTPQEETALEIEKQKALEKAGYGETKQSQITGSQATGWYEKDPKTGKWTQIIAGTGTETEDESKQIENFREDIATLIEKLDQRADYFDEKTGKIKTGYEGEGISWATAWSILRAKYPQASVELIDNMLGLERRKKLEGK